MSSAVSRSRARRTFAGSSPASRAPSAIAERLVADDDQQVHHAGRRLADLEVAGHVRVAELEHLAEHRHAPAGQPGEQVQRRR